MSRIFLSHSSANEIEAVALKQWLADNGWDDVFLDVDPERGLVAGERWQEALRRAADRCEAVVFVVSPAWAKSRWCLAEFLLAKNLHKQIFGVVLEDLPIGELPTEMTAEWQLCHLTGPGSTATIRFVHREKPTEIAFLAEGLKRLKAGLQNAGLSASFFAWPPKGDQSRSPYRGLEPLDARDAAVFFGRDAEILQGLDRLRGMRAAGDQGLFVILGASGAGKSSFLRAGLLPRLARDDRHFYPDCDAERRNAISTTAFKASLPFILRWEGGYVNHPDDPKGWMNRLNALRKEVDLPGYEANVSLDFGDTGYVAKIPDIGENPDFDLE
jgi:hypothetical protein